MRTLVLLLLAACGESASAPIAVQRGMASDIGRVTPSCRRS